jgi:hypothetical protein
VLIDSDTWQLQTATEYAAESSLEPVGEVQYSAVDTGGVKDVQTQNH